MKQDRHIHLTFANAVPGLERDFDEWYDHEHIPDLLRIPGYLRAQRYQLSEVQKQPTRPPTHQQLIIYELEGDPQQIIEATVAAREARLITRNPSLAPDSFGWLYTRVFDLDRSAR